MIYSIVRKLGGFALVSAASLTLHDLSLRQTPEENPIPIPPECGESFVCSTDWLSRALGFSLNSHVQKPLGGGYTSSSVRLNLNPTDNSNPRSAVVKYYSESDAKNWQMRFFLLTLGGIEKLAKKEIFFYQQLRSKLEESGFKSAKPFYLAVHDYGPRSPLLYIMGWRTWFQSVMIFEDLGQHKSFRVGQHIPEDFAEIAAKNLAKLHTTYWDNSVMLKMTNPDLEWKPTAYDTFFGIKKDIFVYPKSKETVTERLNNWQEILPAFKDPELRSNLVSLTDLYSKISNHQAAHVNDSGSYFSHSTLLHGDYHSGNIFWVEDPETKKVNDTIVIDWQCYGIGNPSTEFAYFLGQNVDPDPDRDQRLMKVYYEELTKKISPDSYPFEVFSREVELRSMRMMAWSMNMIKQTPEQQKEMSKLMVKAGTDHQEFFEASAVSNIKRGSYIYQKWQKEKFIEELQNDKEVQKAFLGIKIPNFSLWDLIF